MNDKTTITFWGVRGSLPSPGVSTVWFGGNSPCISFEHAGETIICDCGTGIRELGEHLQRKFSRTNINATILLSHLHLDHLIGLPFFSPLYNKKNSFKFIGGFKKGDMQSALKTIFSPPFFPISFKDMPSKKKFDMPPSKVFVTNKIKVEPFLCNHPGGCWGWRISLPSGACVAVVSDNEPSDAKHKEALIKWMRGANILIHDSQYTPSSYEKHKGWGHSPYTYPIDLASAAGIRKLYLFHYGHDLTDQDVEHLINDARTHSHLKGLLIDVLPTYEGLVVKV